MNRATIIAAAGALLLVAIGAAALAVASSTTPGPVPADRTAVPAPIESVDVAVLESNPRQYVLKVEAGLPSGCAKPAGHQLSRDGDSIRVAVLNTTPTGNVPCTMIYGTYDLSINLGSDFRTGATYSVRVNDRRTTFSGR